MIRLQVRIPNPAQGAGFRLDVTPLDSLTPLSEGTGAFVLGVSRLAASSDAGRLTPVTIPNVWHDLTPLATGINAEGGHRIEAGLPPEPGTLTVTLKNAPDLVTLGVLPGTEIRLIGDSTNFADEVILWWGWVETAVDDWVPADPTEYRKLSHITAKDAAALLGNVTRYGAQSSTAEPLTTRATRLLQSSPVPITADTYEEGSYTGPDGWPVVELGGVCEPTVMETSLLKHLVMAAHSNGLVAALRLPGFLPATFQAAISWHNPERLGFLPRNAPFWLTDDDQAPAPIVPSGPDFPVLQASYHTISVATPQPLLSMLEITNHQVGTDGNALDTTHTVTDPTSLDAFGRRAAGLDMTADPNRVSYAGQKLLNGFSTFPARPTSVEIDAADIDLIALQDPFFVIPIYRLGRLWWTSVARIRHELRPVLGEPPRHRITLDLAHTEPIT